MIREIECLMHLLIYLNVSCPYMTPLSPSPKLYKRDLATGQSISCRD